MAKNYVQAGERITTTAPDETDSVAVLSGDGYELGSIFGVAIADAQPGETLVIQTTGVWSLPKTSAQAWAQGAKVYWTGTEASTTAGGNMLIGAAAKAADNPSATGEVLLIQTLA